MDSNGPCGDGEDAIERRERLWKSWTGPTVAVRGMRSMRPRTFRLSGGLYDSLLITEQ